MEAYLSTMNISSDEARRLFKFLSSQGDEVCYTEFLHGCHLIQGAAQCADLMYLSADLEHIIRMVEQLANRNVPRHRVSKFEA